MKLSEAILLGAGLCIATPCPTDETNGEGCALTMACLATGNGSVAGGGNAWLNADNEWPWLKKVNRDACPADADCKIVHNWTLHCGFITNLQMIAHLFDTHVTECHWTLEQLADWVRSIEPNEEKSPEPEQFPCMSCSVCVEDGYPWDCPYKGPTEAHVKEVRPL